MSDQDLLDTMKGLGDMYRHSYITDDRAVGEALLAGAAEIERLQASIDGLMLEYRPDEVSQGQIEQWEACQRVATKPTEERP